LDGVGFLRTLGIGVGVVFLSDSEFGSPIKLFYTLHSYVRNSNSCLLKW